MTQRLTQAERGFGLLWVAANVVGWIVGFALCEALKAFVSTVLVDGLVIGTGVGLAQWLVLRRRLPRVGWWIVLSILGFGVGNALGEALVATVSSPVRDVLDGALIGASVGAAQWLLLRRRVSGAELWLPANVVGWAVGWTLIGLGEGSETWPVVAVYAVGALGAAVAAIITGLTLISLLRRPIQA